MSSIQEQKHALRDAMRAKRDALASAWVRSFSARIQEAVLDHVLFRKAECVGCYLSLPREVQTWQIVQACWFEGRRVCVPAFDTVRQLYGWAWLEPFDTVRPGPRDVPEPSEVRWAPPSQLDLVIVPAVALDRAGHRLGHGGGHFDRLLAETRGRKFALAFDIQVLEAVPVEDHDVPMDVIVTETCLHAISELSVTEKSNRKDRTKH